MKLRFTPRATKDLIDIGEYISERNPVASLRVRTAILDTIDRAAEEIIILAIQHPAREREHEDL
jgi:plasmid stabilization system protein ParE